MVGSRFFRLCPMHFSCSHYSLSYTKGVWFEAVGRRGFPFVLPNSGQSTKDSLSFFLPQTKVANQLCICCCVGVGHPSTLCRHQKYFVIGATEIMISSLIFAHCNLLVRAIACSEQVCLYLKRKIIPLKFITAISSLLYGFGCSV